MYKLISIDEAMMTRDVKLQNLETNTTDICFDDSGVFSDDYNFEFMKIGETYDCKIQLFGMTDSNRNGNRVVLCKPVKKTVMIGNKKYMKVLVNKDVYYINQNAVSNELDNEEILFKVGRKDLIQVNDVMHSKLLEED